MLDEVLSFSRWMWYYAGCGCGTVWRLAPCCYQYWVLRGDSHGQLGEVASQPPVTDSPEKEEEDILDLEIWSEIGVFPWYLPYSMFQLTWKKWNNTIIIDFNMLVSLFSNYHPQSVCESSLTYVLMWWKVFGLPAYISHLPRKCKLPKVVIQLQCLIIATTRGAAASSGRTAREHRAAREEGSLWWGALYRHHSSVGRVVIWGTSIGKTCHPCRKGVEILLKLSLGKKP